MVADDPFASLVDPKVNLNNEAPKPIQHSAANVHVSPTKEFADKILEQTNFTAFAPAPAETTAAADDDGFGDFGDFEEATAEPAQAQDDGFGNFDEAPSAGGATAVNDDGFCTFDEPTPAINSQ